MATAEAGARMSRASHARTFVIDSVAMLTTTPVATTSRLLISAQVHSLRPAGFGGRGGCDGFDEPSVPDVAPMRRPYRT